jgi:ureidoacrylate peracid hydrolase
VRSTPLSQGERELGVTLGRVADGRIQAEAILWTGSVREIFGKTVLTTIDEIVDPARAALVVVDMQRDFCSPVGYFPQRGCDLSIMGQALPRIERVLRGARAIGLPVIFTQTVHLPGFANLSPAWMRYAFLRYGDPPAVAPVTKGSWGVEIVDELRPIEGEIVVQKGRHSAFVGTNLDQVLRCQGVQSLLIAGTMTQACVETTARDAVCYDYYTVVLSDCVATYTEDLHQASLTMLANRVDLASSDEVLAIWEAVGRTSGRMPASV